MEHKIQDTMNIVDFKTNIDSLTSQLINEYMKLEKLYLQTKQTNHSELLTINDMNSSMTECLQSKSDEINSLHNELQGYSEREKEYMNLINIQREQIEKLKTSSEPETEINKFDMLRSQAKEISAKDKEIERLTKEIVRLKETNDMKQSLSMVVKEEETVMGWSPTTSDTPSPPVDSLDLDKKEDDKEDNKEDDKEDDSDDELFVISYRKKKYYRDKENKVYEIKEDDEVGSFIGMWVKQENGKFKVVKN